MVPPVTLIQVQVADLTSANLSLLYGRKFWSKLNDWAEILPNMDLQPTQDSRETLKEEPHRSLHTAPGQQVIRHLRYHFMSSVNAFLSPRNEGFFDGRGLKVKLCSNLQ